MSLKKVDVTFTDSDGFEKRFEETIITNVFFSYAEAKIETLYAAWTNAEARAAGVAPRVIRQTLPLDLSDPTILGILLEISVTLWQLNFPAPFVTDYSGRDGDGRVEPKIKSMQDLGAVVSDVDMLALIEGKTSARGKQPQEMIEVNQ